MGGVVHQICEEETPLFSALLVTFTLCCSTPVACCRANQQWRSEKQGEART